MKIENRKRKIQSDKIVKELIMYLALLSNGIVFISELDIEEDKTSHTSVRTFQRYAEELEKAGAVPKLIKKQDEYKIDYYLVKEAETEVANTFFAPNPSFSFVVKKADIKNSYAREFLDNYMDFNVEHPNAHIAKLARLCKFANRICRISPEDGRKYNTKSIKNIVENIYRKEISKNFNKRTYQRDIDAVVIAFNLVFNNSKTKRYKEVIDAFLQGYQKDKKTNNKQ